MITSVLFLVACQQEPAAQDKQLGSIVGHAFYSNGDDHSGIVLTLDKTDGLRAITKSDGSRAIVSMSQSREDGSFAFYNLEPGTYTIYASSNDSLEKAVSTNVVVRGTDAVTAEDLHLTATGSISGHVVLDESRTGNVGFLVFLAGTSYVAVTDDSGYYCISNVPAGEGYQLIVSKGGYTSSTVLSCSVAARNTTSIEAINILSAEISSDSNSLVWKGSLAAAPANPKLYWAYFNTEDGSSYIFDGESWSLLASRGAQGIQGEQGPQGPQGETGATGAQGPQGETGATGAAGANGTSISWKGSLAAAPAEPSLYWAYFNTEDGCSYIYDGTQWTLLASKGAQGEQGIQGETGAQGPQGETGATGAQGPQGETGATGPQGPQGETGATGATGAIGATGAAGADGVSIIWLGSFATAPQNPERLNAYYNTETGCSYIYDGMQWTLLASKGAQG
ncbi:MAG: carboxypeptidase regulatory-like domain-containing protein, partial [Spirochaetales bacterium]|nr:carboxypeptidase regulatory-like domain-containing protein [Spirochaetales bacterium]